MIKRFFTRHPQSVGETYFEHLRTASRFSATMLLTGMACLIHGFAPALFVNTGSRTIKRLHDDMSSRNSGAHSAGEDI